MGDTIEITEKTTCFLCDGNLKQLPNNIEGQKIIDYYPNWHFCTNCGRRFINKSVPNVQDNRLAMPERCCLTYLPTGD